MPASIPISPRDVEEANKPVQSDSEDTYAGVQSDKETQDPDPGNKAPEFVNDAPDGGTAAWLCVLGAWCTAFCSFGWLNSMFSPQPGALV